MDANFRILEDRVSRAIERIRDLASERDHLEARVGALEHEATELLGEQAKLPGGLSGETRQASIDDIAAGLRRVIEDLRA